MRALKGRCGCDAQMRRAAEQGLHELRHLKAFPAIAAGARPLAPPPPDPATTGAGGEDICRIIGALEQAGLQPAGAAEAPAATGWIRSPAATGAAAARPVARAQHTTAHAAPKSNCSTATCEPELGKCDGAATGASKVWGFGPDGPTLEGDRNTLVTERLAVFVMLCRPALAALFKGEGEGTAGARVAALSATQSDVLREAADLLQSGESSLVEDEVACLHLQFGKLGVLDGDKLSNTLKEELCCGCRVPDS